LKLSLIQTIKESVSRMNINMKKFLFILTAAGLILAGGGTAFTWEPYDAIIAIVNDTSIIESDINNK
jgi:hypothetical protein